MDQKEVFKKIQNLNNFSKKIIVLGIIAVLAIFLGGFIIKNFQQNLQKFQKTKGNEFKNLIKPEIQAEDIFN